MNNIEETDFQYSDERFADIQLLRYRLNGFDQLTLRQKLYIYYLSMATLAGRDIVTDQQCRYNIRIRKTLEAIVGEQKNDGDNPEFQALMTYLKQVWFANGIHHHYGCEKFTPGFTSDYFRSALKRLSPKQLPMKEGQSAEEFADEMVRVIFDKHFLAKRVNLSDGEDLIETSACNYYEGVSQKEVESFYAAMKEDGNEEPPSYGLNSKLVKEDGELHEIKWTTHGLYSEPLRHIIGYLKKAREFAENEHQQTLIDLLVDYYETGDLHTFDQYSIEWLKEQDGQVDFINGFIEVYGDPLGLKASWEGLVEYKDLEATRRTQLISDNAQWFEDHSPVDPRFKKQQVKGVTASVICAAMLGGDEYPASPIGINLPNADWIRARYGSKSVTIGNLTEAYSKASLGNGFYEEFVCDEKTRLMISEYGSLCDDLHTDLHECLGHGSGQLLPNTDPDALKAYGSTIEEARADLFGLYYIADEKLVELGILPNATAYYSQYYTYLLNGLLTQNVRIKSGQQLEEAHMRNRALIANWVHEHSNGVVELKKMDGKTVLLIHDYGQVRILFARLLAEIQRIKSQGDYEEAKHLIETYAVHINPKLHEEVLERYAHLGIAPYKGFINPRLLPVRNAEGIITDIKVDYTESFSDQMIRYGKEYGFL